MAVGVSVVAISVTSALSISFEISVGLDVAEATSVGGTFTPAKSSDSFGL